jgi:predicted GNAT family acetyltransferase
VSALRLDGNWVFMERSYVRDWLKAHGYDGYWSLESFQGIKSRALQVFDPCQIKSAIFNKGTYSRTNCNITESKRLMSETKEPPSTGDTSALNEVVVPDSPEFKKWFGDSKIVNPDGTPKIMYHGTSKLPIFRRFKKPQTDGYFALANQRIGISVAPSPELASAFSDITDFEWRINGGTPSQREYANTKMKPRVIPVYVRCEHPWDYTNPEDVEKLAEEIMKVEKLDSADKESLLIALSIEGNWWHIERPYIRDWLESQGYDGYWTLENFQGVTSRTLQVFDPCQIKSAIFNKGTYSRTNCDITENKRLMPETKEPLSTRDTSTRDTSALNEVVVPDSPEFKKWFGDSKIVNPDGTPKVMYHGTSKLPIFSRFKKPRRRKYDLPTTKRRIGISVSESPEFASAFSDMNNFERYINKGSSKRRKYADTKMKPRVIPVYVRCEHPWDYENPKDVESLAEEIMRVEKTKFADKKSLLTTLSTEENWWHIERPYIRDWLKAHGYDGYWSLESFRGATSRTLQVFDPCQIKSAIFNKGTYSRTNCNINESKEYSTAVGSLYIMNDVTGSHHGQMEGTLYALKPEDRYAEDFYRKALGAIDWVIYDDELTISNIVVKPELRRKGIATALLKALLEEFPSVKYRASTRTPDGTAFFETDKVKQLFAEKNISLNEEKE